MHVGSTLFKDQFTGFKVYFYSFIIYLIKFRLAKATKNVGFIFAGRTSFNILSILIHGLTSKL